MPPLKVLVAEDDSAIRELVLHHLRAAGFDAHGVADGNLALQFSRASVDLLVLDAGLPAVDGFDVARVLRRDRVELPILMLTARGEEVDRIVAFELGVDDYVVKPFSPRELVARVKAIARRIGRPLERSAQATTYGRLHVDEAAREVRVDGERVHLKPREFALLLTLCANAGVALSRKTLLERVWGFDFPGDERTVDVHVRRLRAKVEESYGLPPVILTVHGYGYKFCPP